MDDSLIRLVIYNWYYKIKRNLGLTWGLKMWIDVFPHLSDTSFDNSSLFTVLKDSEHLTHGKLSS